MRNLTKMNIRGLRSRIHEVVRCSATRRYILGEAGILAALLAVLCFYQEEATLAGFILAVVSLFLSLMNDRRLRAAVLALSTLSTCLLVGLYWPPDASGFPRFTLRAHPIRGIVMIGGKSIEGQAELLLPDPQHKVTTDRAGRFQFHLAGAPADSLHFEVEYDGQRFPFTVGDLRDLRRGRTDLSLDLPSSPSVHGWSVGSSVSTVAWGRCGRASASLLVGALLVGIPCALSRPKERVHERDSVAAPPNGEGLVL